MKPQVNPERTRLGRALGLWVGGAARFAPWVLLLVLALSVGAFLYARDHLGIDSNLDDMLSPELPFRRAQARFLEAFPQFDANLVLVVDGETPERARSAALALAGRLRAREDLYRDVTVPRAVPFLEAHALYYLDLDELADLGDRLAEVQPFLGRLTRDPSLRGLVDMLDRAIEERVKGGNYDVTPLVKQVDRALAGVLAGQPIHVSWQELMRERDEAEKPDDRRQIVLARAVLDYGSLQPAGPSIEG
ncbi:MAG: hopanoid biosynthesis-associated RND transporter HpnN, partial [Planctomycetota bacterium]